MRWPLSLTLTLTLTYPYHYPYHYPYLYARVRVKEPSKRLTLTQRPAPTLSANWVSSLPYPYPLNRSRCSTWRSS